MGDSIGTRLLGFIKKIALKVLFSDDMKRKLIADLNLKIDIPLLDEKTEKELFEIIWDYLKEGFEKQLTTDK